MLDAYLHELERKLARTLPPEELPARLAEAEAHLRDGVEGRVDLGMDRLGAERETIAAFGDASRTARAIGHVTYARSIVVRLRFLTGAYATLIVSYGALDFLRERLPFLSAILVLFVGVGLAGVASVAFRVRRSASIPLLASGFAASLSLWLFFGFFWLNLWNYGGMGFQSRLRVDESIRRMKADLELPKHGSVDYSFREDDLRAIPQAIADPIGNWASQCGLSIGLGMTVAGVFTLVDFCFAALGSAASVRHRRRTGVA